MGKKYFPLFVSIEDKKILLVGAGNIALRRAQGLLRFGAMLTVVAPRMRTEFEKLREQYGPSALCLQQRAFRPGEIEGYDFVLAATSDPAVDGQVYGECKNAGIPVSIASDQNLCDFQFPALIECGNIVIGVNSGGSDHRKVRRVSADIRELLGERYPEEKDR